MMFKTSSAVVCCAFLAACGGGVGGSGGVASFGELENQFSSIGSSFTLADITQPSDLPSSGTANFQGVMEYRIAGNPALNLAEIEFLGEATLNVNFATGEVAGRGELFRDVNNNPVAGAIRLETTTINPNANPPFAGNTVTGTASGALQGGDGILYSLQNGTYAGNFAVGVDFFSGGLQGQTSPTGQPTRPVTALIRTENTN